jgi:hypothetical protein
MSEAYYVMSGNGSVTVDAETAKTINSNLVFSPSCGHRFLEHDPPPAGILHAPP